MSFDVELGVEIPVGITQVKRRRDHKLPVARDLVEFGMDVGDKFTERDRSIE